MDQKLPSRGVQVLYLENSDEVDWLSENVKSGGEILDLLVLMLSVKKSKTFQHIWNHISDTEFQYIARSEHLKVDKYYELKVN